MDKPVQQEDHEIVSPKEGRRERAPRLRAASAAVLASAIIMALIAFLALAPASPAAGDPFLNAVTVDEQELLLPPLVTDDVSISGTFRINFNQSVSDPSYTVLAAVRDLVEGGLTFSQKVLAPDGRSLALYVPGGLLPHRTYQIEVTVLVPGEGLWRRTYVFVTGETKPPAVDFSVPGRGETGVPTDLGGVFLHYNTPMDRASFDPGLFGIYDLTHGAAIPSNNQIYPDNRFIGLGTPPWVSNHLYRVEAKAGMRSQGGQTIGEDYSFLFSTDDLSGGLPPQVKGVYPLPGSQVDGRSPVIARIQQDLPLGPFSPDVWKSLVRAHKAGGYVGQVINPHLIVAVPQRAPGFDPIIAAIADEITLWANLSSELPVIGGTFPGFAWSWTASRPAKWFTDVGTDDPYYPYIKSIQAEGYISGFPNSDGSFRFGGNQTLTRAQGAKIFVNAFRIPVDLSNISTPFLDVYADAQGYPAAYVNAGVTAKMIQGKTPTSFDPYSPLLYRHVVLMEVRRLKEILPAELYPDPPPGFTIGWGFPEADWAAYHGFLVGMGEKTAEHPLGDPASINPYAPITRNDAAAAAANVTYQLQMFGYL